MTNISLRHIGASAKRWSLTFMGASALLLGTPACEDSLTETPYSFYSVNTFFKNVNQATMSVMGIYEVLGQLDTYGRSSSMAYAVDNDQDYMRGASLSGNQRLVAHYAVTPAHSWIQTSWQLYYQGIDRANLAIRKIEEMELFENGSESEKSELRRLLGEALFLRGLIYFDLVRFWGDVPFKTTPTALGDDLRLPRTNREEVYDQIVADIETAIPLLPEASKKKNDERVGKGAARGILTRILLARGGYSLQMNGQTTRLPNYKDYYAKALEQTSAIIASGEHSLNPSYEEIFRNYCSLKLEPKESMFEIAFFNVNGNDQNSSIVGTWNSPLTDINSPYGRANSFINTHPLFYRSFETNDLRRDVAVATFQVNAQGQEIPMTGNRDAEWAPGKWRRNWQGTSPKNPNNTDINWVMLRYSDVLLMHAEASNELKGGPDADAYNAVNLVRRRAGLPDLEAGLSQSAFFEKIVVERGHELCFEGWRKFDLIRWNRLGDYLRRTQADLRTYRNNFPYIAGQQFADGKHELFPIPQREMDQNSALVQNPGY